MLPPRCPLKRIVPLYRCSVPRQSRVRGPRAADLLQRERRWWRGWGGGGFGQAPAHCERWSRCTAAATSAAGAGAARPHWGPQGGAAGGGATVHPAGQVRCGHRCGRCRMGLGRRLSRECRKPSRLCGAESCSIHAPPRTCTMHCSIAHHGRIPSPPCPPPPLLPGRFRR